MRRDLPVTSALADGVTALAGNRTSGEAAWQFIVSVADRSVIRFHEYVDPERAVYAG